MDPFAEWIKPWFFFKSFIRALFVQEFVTCNDATMTRGDI